MYTVSIIDYNGTPTSSTPTAVNQELYIYDPVTNDEGLVVVDPMLSLEVSKAGSFSCSLPQTNYGFGRIIDKVTRLIVRKDNKIIFIGRINSEDRDLYLTQKIVAEGALAYLNDSLTPKITKVASNPSSEYPYKTTTRLGDLLWYIFDNHNSKFASEPWKKFHFARTAVEGNNGYTYPNCHAEFVGYNSKDVNSNELTQLNLNFDTTLSIVESLLDTANAMLNIEWDDTNNYWEVYIYNKFDTGENSAIPKTSQPIEFGLNLLDLTQSYDSTDIVTAVAPFGGDLIQESKEIGDIMCMNGYNVNDEHDTFQIYGKCLWRGENDYDYEIYSSGEFGDGCFAFEWSIEDYNNAHPDHPIKKLYLSWRAYQFNTGTGYVADNAWRIYEKIVENGVTTYQTLGFHELTGGGAFESEINEVIDLTDPAYTTATHIRVGGWGGLIRPQIRRDAIIVEEADKLNISKCGTFSTDGLSHTEGEYYLYSDTLINTYGLIEKKVEFDIEDEKTPKIITDYTTGGFAYFPSSVLGYTIEYDAEQNPDYETNKGAYTVVDLSHEQGDWSMYAVIEYGVPVLGSSARPRGVFVTTRMHDIGDINGKKINGMYVLLDTSGQLLNYKSAAASEKGLGFTSLYREYIDLNDPQNYGVNTIRVGGYIGSGFGLELLPSDDAKPRNRLMDQAKLYLTSYQWDKIVIEAQAVDLSMTSSEWEALDICKLAQVNSSYHGATFYKPITSLELNLNNFEDNSIKLGYDNDELMSYQLNESLRLTAIETAKQNATTT